MPDSQIYPHGLTGRTIRLLTIQPGELDSALHCTLEETCLDDRLTSYHALSYCWGAARSSVQITCNSQPLLITPNLHSALLEYRRRGINLPLWADAVCINQFDVSERTLQVRMMQDIYSKAARVVVWLGEAEATDRLALEVLKAIHAPWASVLDSLGRRIPCFTGQDDASYDASLAARVPDAAFDALAAFLLRPWFSRIWIIQELVCARETMIWCGSETLNEDFPLLEAAARLFTTMPNMNGKTQLATTALNNKEAEGIGRSKMMCAGRLWGFKLFKDKGQSGILWNLLVTRCFDSTDPRDKIFALVGLSSDIGEDFVDYSKSYEEKVQELSRMSLDGRIENINGSTLDVWSCLTRYQGEDLSSPSWVVDWLKLRDSLYTPLMGQYGSEQPMIHRVPEIRFAVADGRDTLQVRGTVFDTITQILPSPIVMREVVPQSDFLHSQHLPSLLDWRTNAINTVARISVDTDGIYKATGEPLYEAFWRTLCCNRSGMDPLQAPVDHSSYIAWERFLDLQMERHKLDMKYRRICQWGRRLGCALTSIVISGLTYRFRRHKLLFVLFPFCLPSLIQFNNTTWDSALSALLLNLMTSYLQSSTQVQIEQRDFENSHSLWTQGRQLAITQLGLIGWVPLAARVGDNVGLFAGCRIPFVMRASLSGYKIVGDTYMHGVMNGEGESSEGEMLPIF